MDLLIDILISALILIGGAFALIGSWGLVRLPTLMTRLHGPTKATTLGVGSCLIASLIYFPARGGVFTIHELLITLFLFITAPIAANLIAKAHLHRQFERIDAKPMDDIRDNLPFPGQNAGWATLGKDARNRNRKD